MAAVKQLPKHLLIAFLIGDTDDIKALAARGRVQFQREKSREKCAFPRTRPFLLGAE